MRSKSNVGRRFLTGEFGLLYSEMANWHGWSSPSIRDNALGEARNLFRWLHGHGRGNMPSVTLGDIRDYYMHRIQEVGCPKSIRRSMRRVFTCLTETGKVGFDPFPVFELKVPKRRRLLPAMDADKTAMILDAIDRNTGVGKRDYAFILLAAATGLRRSDIAKLRRRDIDWREGVINVMQRKTSRAISLPLLRGVGDALKDYILNGRGDSQLESVFLSTRRERPLDPRTMASAFSRYCREAGVDRRPLDGLSLHSLRRSVGKRLCTAGVPLTTIAQCLGHADMESTGNYISLDGKSLAGCALGFDGIGEGGVLWN